MVRCLEMVEYAILHDALGRHCQKLSWRWGWEVLQQPPISPDLSPRFSDLILRLHGKQFSKRENILTAVWHKVAQVMMMVCTYFFIIDSKL